jgi:uncharacterized protein
MPENSTPTPPPRRKSGVDTRSPYVFDLREVGRRPGAMREYRRRGPAPAGLGTDVIGVPEGAPLVVDVRLESVTEGVLVTGTVSGDRGTLRGECARCLDPIADTLVVDFCELFAYPNSVTEETTSEDEIHRIEGDHLDIEPVVRDAVVLGLPWTPLCRPDCPGLCSDCGERLADLPADHQHDLLDPRWAALAAFAQPAPADDRSTTGTNQISTSSISDSSNRE